MRSIIAVSGLALAIGLSISGCGGGAGADAALPGLAPAPVATASGLVAASDPSGPVLAQDAAPLRMLRPQGAWTYRGIEERGDATTRATSVYSNTITMSNASGSYVETASNRAIDGLDAAGMVSVDGGRYTHTETISYDNLRVASATMVELSSPVRQNDQFVSVDRKGIPLGKDYNGDGINDEVDVAVWSRVIGKETLDLPNRRAVEAVRVDTTLRARLVLSRETAAAPVQEIVRSYWYAPGLGIVQKRIDTPDLNPQLRRRVITETLELWDGESEGLGYLAPSATIVPLGLSPEAATRLRAPVAVAAFGSHAVVAANLPGQAPAAGIALAQLDSRGKLLALRSYETAELFPGAATLAEPRLLRVGDELRLFARASPLGVVMLPIDPTGQRILRPPVVLNAETGITSDLEGNTYQVAEGDGRIWLNWIRLGRGSNGAYQRAMLVQPFDRAGLPSGAPTIVRSGIENNLDHVGMVFGDKRLALSWRESLTSRRLALIDGASGAPSERPLDIGESACGKVGLAALQPGLAITCQGFMPAPFRAVRLDAAGVPVLAGNGQLSGEALQASWLLDPGNGSTFFGGGGELTLVAHQYGSMWTEGLDVANFMTVLRTRSLDGRLAGREPILLARIPELQMKVMDTVQLGNRLLLVGSNSIGELSTAVVWLPN